ncbi:heavy metal translocatin [Lactarius vividus]|nr:heavy metal translocatin [Lactarius vividus]
MLERTHAPLAVSYRDSGSSEADVSSLSVQSNPGGSAAGSDCCSGNTLRHVSQPRQMCRINTGPASDNTLNTITCGASHSELDEDRFAVSEKAAELGDSQNQTLLLSIQGMNCPCCAHKVTTALLSIPSVQDVKVNIFIGQVSLTYKEGITEPVNIAKRTTELTGYACVIPSAQFEGSRRILRIALPTVSRFSTKVPKLPFGVEILNTSSTTSGTILDVQYNPMIVAPRTVVDSFAAIGGSFLPPSKSTASLQASREIYNLFIRTLISFILCIPVLVFSWAPIQPHPIIYGAISLFLATCIQICAGGPLYSTAFRTLFLQHTLDTDALVILSSTIAYLFSFIAYVVQVTGHEFNTPFFETPALLLTLISIGELIGLYARRRATSALDSLGTLQPDYVQLVTSDGSITVIHAELTQSNDILRVSADTLVPTDGIVIRGMTQVDESALTGESLPVDKDRGAPLTAGTRNVTCSVDMKVIRVPAENTIAEISALVARLQEARLSIQDLADRAAGWLGPVILVVAIIVFVVWIIVGLRVRNENLNHAGLGALRYTIAVLVVSCPCAIVLCVPMVIVITGAVAAREGVLFKSRAVLMSVQTAIATQCVKDTTVAVFDKTGTLTLGEMAVVEAHINRQDSVETILSLVSKSSHPVAQSIAKYLRATYPHCEDPSLDKVQSILGKGLEMTTSDGVLIRGGSPSWLGLQADPLYSSMMAKALSMFAVTFDDELVGFFGLTDLPRPSAGAAVRLLQAQGIQVHIVSGDAAPVVHALAAQLGVPPEFAHGGCLPAEKVTHVQELQAPGGRVLFIGDGTNDTPALAAADVSVAMGGGTDVARDTADIVFLAPDLERALGVLLRLSRGAVLRVYINCVWACVYNFFAVLLAAGAFVHVRIAPEYAGFGEMVSVVPVVVVAWSMWFLKC